MIMTVNQIMNKNIEFTKATEVRALLCDGVELETSIQGSHTSSFHSLPAKGFRDTTRCTVFPAPANMGTAPLQSKSFTT